jgi:hypothetical protein
VPGSLAPAVKARRLAIRLLAIVTLAAAGFLAYHVGKEFDVIIDNGSVAIEGARYESMPYGTVYIDGDAKGFDLWAGDRVIKKMAGKKHRLTIKVLKEEDDSVVKTVEREITLNFNPKAKMVSAPAIIAEAENILTPNPLYSAEPVFAPDPAPAQKEGVPDDIFGGIEP